MAKVEEELAAREPGTLPEVGTVPPPTEEEEMANIFDKLAADVSGTAAFLGVFVAVLDDFYQSYIGLLHLTFVNFNFWVLVLFLGR